MQLFRSLIFQFWFYGSAVLFAALVVMCAPFSYATRFSIARGWGHTMLWGGRVLCGWDYLIEGQEHIPSEASVIMIKHSTVFETYAQLVIFPPQTWVLKRGLQWIPIFGWGLALMKPIAINRSAGRRAVNQVIELGKKRLASGIWVSIFPEGTRVAAGETKKYGVSGAALAIEAGCSIVPVAHNAGEFWPRRGLSKKPGLIRFCIGPPIDPAGKTPKETSELVRTWIENKMTEISDSHR